MTFFSVIIPLYNKEKYVLNTIKSVLNQSFQDFEIIIVDDGSTDQSLQVINSVNNPKITIIQQKNQKVYKPIKTRDSLVIILEIKGNKLFLEYLWQ